MPIVVEHQPAFAAPGMMAAQTGQLEYRNKRRRELEQLAMQQAEMAQRQQMSNNNITAGFQKQQIAHQMNLQNNQLQWQRGMIDDEAHHNRQKELVDINQQNQLKIAQAKDAKDAEDKRLQAIQDEENRKAQIKADAEASTMAMLTPAGQENRNNIHAEWTDTEAKLNEEGAPPEAIAEARAQYEQRLKDNRNNPQYLKPVDTHYPATTEHWTSPSEHTIYDNDGNATIQWAGKKRNPNYDPNAVEGNEANGTAGIAVNENGFPIMDANGMPQKYESEFVPQSREEYLYEKRETRGSEEDGTLSYREGTLDEHNNYKPGTKWVNVAEEEAKAVEAKLKLQYLNSIKDWYNAPPETRGAKPTDPFANEDAVWHPGDEIGPADDAVHRPGTAPAPQDVPLDTAFNAYPEIAGGIAGDMGMEETMLTLGINPNDPNGVPEMTELTPEQIQARSQFDRPDALPRTSLQDYGVDVYYKKREVGQYDVEITRPDGTRGGIPIYAVDPQDRQAVYQNRKNKPYVVKWPAKADFNQQNLANVILEKDNPIMFGTVIDLSKITSPSGKAFAKAWEERTGSPNFVFEREFILNIGRKAYRGQEYNDFEDKVLQQEKEHYEFYGFPGDFQSQSQQGGALGRILQAGGAR